MGLVARTLARRHIDSVNMHFVSSQLSIDTLIEALIGVAYIL